MHEQLPLSARPPASAASPHSAAVGTEKRHACPRPGAANSDHAGGSDSLAATAVGNVNAERVIFFDTAPAAASTGHAAATNRGSRGGRSTSGQADRGHAVPERRPKGNKRAMKRDQQSSVRSSETQHQPKCTLLPHAGDKAASTTTPDKVNPRQYTHGRSVLASYRARPSHPARSQRKQLPPPAHPRRQRRARRHRRGRRPPAAGAVSPSPRGGRTASRGGTPRTPAREKPTRPQSGRRGRAVATPRRPRPPAARCRRGRGGAGRWSLAAAPAGDTLRQRRA